MRMTSLRVPTSAGLFLALLLAAPFALADQKDETYNKGQAAVNAGDSVAAAAAFCALPADFKDSGAQCSTYKPLADKALFRYKQNYADGQAALQAGNFDLAEQKFKNVKAGDFYNLAQQKLAEIPGLKAKAQEAANAGQAAETANKNKLDQGTSAFNSGNMDAAEAALSGVTGSHQGEAQALLQKVRAYKADIQKGQAFENAKDFQAAKNAYADAVNINPSGPANGMLARATAALSSPTPNNPPPTTTTATVKPPAPVKQIDVAAYIRDGQKALSKKDYRKAKRFFQEVLGQEPKNQDATDALAQINSLDTSTVQASDDDPQLSRYIGAFYSGQYATAEQLLNTYIFTQPKGKGKLGLANFYLGASMMTRYYLSGANDANLKREAETKFSDAKKVDGFKAPDKFISPKIMKAFEEAS